MKLCINKKILIITLICTLFLLPAFSELTVFYKFFSKYDYICYIIIGIIGLFIFLYSIFNILKNKNENTNKELVPIILLALYMMWTLISSILSPNKELAFYRDRL